MRTDDGDEELSESQRTGTPRPIGFWVPALGFGAAVVVAAGVPIGLMRSWLPGGMLVTFDEELPT